MSRICDLSGVGPMVGHNVSHSQRKTKRRFLPNLVRVTLMSDKLGRTFSLRVAAKTLRTVDKLGGLDAYLMHHRDEKLAPEALRIKRLVKKADGPADVTEVMTV